MPSPHLLSSPKIVSLAKLSQTVEQHALADKKTVLVGGCFDILHFGHLSFLTQAKEAGDLLVLLLESDEFIKTKKGKQPIHNQDQRAAILASLYQVDFVVLLPYLKTYREYLDVIKMIKPKLIGVTRGDINLNFKKRQAQEIGAEVIEIIDTVGNFSSSKILHEIISSN